MYSSIKLLTKCTVTQYVLRHALHAMYKAFKRHLDQAHCVHSYLLPHKGNVSNLFKFWLHCKYFRCKSYYFLLYSITKWLFPLTITFFNFKKVVENSTDSSLLPKDVPITKVHLFRCSIDVVWMWSLQCTHMCQGGVKRKLKSYDGL